MSYSSIMGAQPPAALDVISDVMRVYYNSVPERPIDITLPVCRMLLGFHIFATVSSTINTLCLPHSPSKGLHADCGLPPSPHIVTPQRVPKP